MKRLLLTSFALMGAAFVSTSALADYKSTILGDSPAGYYRLSDWPTNFAVATNSGSGGAALNGVYQTGASSGAPGAIVGDTDTAGSFAGLARVEVAYAAALNPAGPFSVECWAMVTNTAYNANYRSPVSCRDNLRGYILYANSANQWSFWIGSGTAWVSMNGPTVTANVWTHVVATRDSLGTNRLYINGLPVLSNSAPTFAANLLQPFRIGAGANESLAGNYYWPGRIDEVAFYGSQLSAAQIAAHYSSATNAARSQPYSQMITNDGAVGYWRLDDAAPNPALTATNIGSLGAVANGAYLGSAATLWPGQTGALGGDPDFAVALSNATTLPYGAKINVPNNSGLNPSNLTVEAWVNLPSLYRDYQAVVCSRDLISSTSRGFILYANNAGNWQFWTGRMLNSWNSVVATNTLITGAWNHVVGTFDGTYQFLYVNSELVGMTKPILPYVPNTTAPLRIGGGNSEDPAGSYFVNGSIDEVAVYGAALPQSSIANHYAAAFSAPPAQVTAPYFVLNPTNATIQTGVGLSLDAVAYGGVPMQYQWFKDGNPVPGQTNFVLSLPNPSVTDSGGYYLGATNGVGSALSSTSAVVVLPAGLPGIAVDLPPSLTLFVGASPKLSVTAAGSAPFAYQWTSNGVALPGGTNAILQLTNVQAALNGSVYQVLVSNPYGTTNSTAATVTVVTPNPASYANTMLMNGLLSYWRLGEASPSTIAVDYWGGNNGVYVNASQHYTPGALGLDDDGAVQLTGAGSFVIVSNAAPYDFSGTNAFTLSAWVRPEALTGVQRIFSVRRYASNTAPSGFGFGFNGATQLRFTSFGVVDVGLTVAAVTGQWQHLAAVRSGTSVTLYFNGVSAGTSTVLSIIKSGEPLRLGGDPDIGGGEEFFNGEVDEAAIFNRALTPAEIAALYSARNGAKPNIVVNPSPISTLAGGTAVFTVTAAGTPPLAYQWKSNSVVIAGATNSVLALTNVQAAWGTPSYSVTVTNLAGLTNSTAAALTVIKAGPYAAAVVSGNPVAYWRLDETNGPTIYDQWGGHNGGPNGGITYAVPGALLGDPDTAMGFDGTSAKVDVPYSADISTPVFSIECWVQMATETGAYQSPITLRNGASSGANIYSGFIFYATPANIWSFWTGNGSAWQTLNGPAISTGQWTHLAGTFDGTTKNFYVNGVLVGSVATTYLPTVTLPLRIGSGASETAGNYWFNGDVDEVALYNTAMSPSLITYHYLLGLYGTNTPPFVTQSPSSQSAVVGGSATFSGAGAGSPPLAYQWQFDGAPLAGATNSTLTVSNAYFTSAGAYALVIANGAGSITSAPAALSVLPPPTFANLTNGLVLHLPFEGNQLTDTSGSGNDAQMSGLPTFAPGIIGTSAIYVSTTNSIAYNSIYVNPNTNLTFGPTDNFSVAFWVSYTGLPDDLPMIGNAVGSTYQLGWTFTDSGGKIECSLASTPNSGAYVMNPLPNSPVTADGAWHSVVGTIDRTNAVAAVYVDGTLAGTWSIAGLDTLDYGNSIAIGQDPTYGYNVTGAYAIDDVGLWNRVLTAYDAAGIYAAGQNHRSFDVAGPVILHLQVSGSNLDLSWQAGTLLQSSKASGPYTPVPGAVAPFYRTTAAGTAMFYRVHL